MIYIAYIIIFFISYQLFSALINLLFKSVLPKSTQTIQKELVSVLIPARNEEKNILNILSDLQKIDYQNIEIIVFDDESDDDTAKIIKQQAQKDSRIIYIKSDGLPAGWLGKNYACYSLSKIARGSILLFLDADVRIKNDIIDKSINYLRRHKLGLLTIFPKQIMHTKGEKMVVPLMNYILISLLPLIFVRISPFTSHAAGNGQFMMFDKKIYDKYLPHKKLKNSAVEDIESVKYFKKQKVNTACLLGEDDIYCRMYNSFVDAINGFSKNVNHFFGKSYLLSLIFWIITTPGFIFLIKLPNIYLWYFLISTILIVIITSYLSKQNILLNIILLPVHRIVLLYIIINSIIIKIKKDYKWRGRNIYHY